jgi:hypothetical protein
MFFGSAGHDLAALAQKHLALHRDKEYEGAGGVLARYVAEPNRE